MKKFYIIYLFCLCFLPSFSQEHFTPGNILTLNHDTLKGMLDFRDWELNPSKVRFRDSQGIIRIFRPMEIIAFWTSKDAFYLSKRLSMDVSNYRVPDLVNDASVKIVRDTSVFVRLMVDGRLKLYFLRDSKDKDHYWFQNNNDSVFEMRITRKMITTQGVAHSSDRAIATLNLYQIILPGIVADCPSLTEKAGKAEFSLNSFKNIAFKYNECTGSGGTTSVVAKERKVKVNFGFIAGASMISLKFFGAKNVPLTHTTFPFTWTYMGGLALKIILPYMHGSWIIYNDLVYRPYHVSSTFDSTNFYVPFANTHYIYTFDITMGYLKLNTMLRYQFPKWAVKPFVNVGMSNSFALVNKNSQTETVSTVPPTTREGPAIQDTKNYEAGLVCGIGLCWKGLGFEFRYEWANGMSAYAGFTGSENSYSLLLSYTLGQK